MLEKLLDSLEIMNKIYKQDIENMILFLWLNNVKFNQKIIIIAIYEMGEILGKVIIKMEIKINSKMLYNFLNISK